LFFNTLLKFRPEFISVGRPLILPQSVSAGLIVVGQTRSYLKNASDSRCRNGGHVVNCTYSSFEYT
jgi:hypothetical protein